LIVTFDRDLYERLRQHSERTGMSMAAIVRVAVDEYLERTAPPGHPAP